MTRRDVLKRVGFLLGAAVSAPLASGLLGGCRPRTAGEGYAPRALSAEQDELVVALTERILPETDTPGARTARVNTFVDEMLGGWYPEEERAVFFDGLDDVEARAGEAYGASFAALAPEEQDAILEELDREAYAGDRPAGEPSFYRMLKELTLVGYYTSEVGATQELRMNPMGVYHGDVAYQEVGRAWA